jgi:XTP/dITP diphosphohydrolase
MNIYAATSNPGKLRDFALAASDADATIQIEPLPGLATIPAPPEDEPTFEANARVKAVYYSLRAPGVLVLADDSGLEVDALDGAPGVRSARFAADLAHPDADTPDNRNNAALLDALADVPETRRQARYRCSLALARDGLVLHTAEGTVEGSILPAPRGNGGFGYDPLFYLPQLGRTMSELAPTDRLALNHRGRALAELLRILHNAKN